MTERLSILHLEDDPLDTELVRDILAADGFLVDIDRVDTLPSFRERLESPCALDLILSDFSIPGTDIYEAIATAQRLRPEIPLIILSGTLGEEKAIEMIHRGASDYVLKQRMARLTPAIHRALREAQEQQRRLAAEEALLAAKEAAEAGNRAKDRFLLTVSHELRTPLTVIMGMNELALTEDLPPRARTYLDAARKSSETLLALINDILDFSGIEQGRIALEEESFDFPEALREVVTSFVPRAQEKGLALSLVLPPSPSLEVIGDRRRLQQILRNLVGNAVRFTQEGRIEIVAGCEGEAGGRTECSISIRDTGIGIPDEALDHIFDRFSQADMSLTRRFGGPGLGLAISRGLVERMGGRIDAESRQGEGSRFSITLPFRIDGGISPAPLSATGEHRTAPRILMAEDDPMIGDLVQMILKRRNWSAEVVPDGQAALERWKKGGVDLILMDMQMPVMNGLEATRSIRAHETDGLRTPIIAMTAHAREEDRRACREAGMDGFVTKPINMRELYATLEKYLRP